jgi:hypothetical protein
MCTLLEVPPHQGVSKTQKHLKTSVSACVKNIQEILCQEEEKQILTDGEKLTRKWTVISQK